MRTKTTPSRTSINQRQQAEKEPKIAKKSREKFSLLSLLKWNAPENTWGRHSWQFLFALLLLVITTFLVVAFGSYLVNGASNQSLLINGDDALSTAELKGSTGVYGIKVMHYLVNGWIGLGFIFIIYLFILCTLRLSTSIRMNYLKQSLFSIIMAGWSSLFFASLPSNWFSGSFFLLGGVLGEKMYAYLNRSIGVVGVTLLLLFVLVLLLFCSFSTFQEKFSRWLSREPKGEKSDTKSATFDEGNPAEEVDSTGIPTVDSLVMEKRPTPIDRLDEVGYEASYPTPDDATLKSKGGEEKEAGIEVNINNPEEDLYAGDYVPNLNVQDREELPPLEAEREEQNHDPSHASISSRVSTEANSDPKEVTLEVVDNRATEDELDDLTVAERAALLVKEQGPYDPRKELPNYQFPSLDILTRYDQEGHEIDQEEIQWNKELITNTLKSFNIDILSITATVGPTITLYEVIPAAGIHISKIRNLEDNISMNLSAQGIRIIAPIPGKGTIGLEVPNKNPQIVSMRSVIASKKFQESTYELPVAIGRTITNEVFVFDLAKAPHLLVAGATGQGKSVGLNAIISSLLYKKHPAELKFVMVDPKMVEFSMYSVIEKHYMAKLPGEEQTIITDSDRVVPTLLSLCQEMDDRYRLLADAHVRNLKEYNAKFIGRLLNPEKGHRYLPYIVLIIDEYGDLLTTAGKEIELPITRLAQKARAIGIHAILATQRPSAQIITGAIKANFPGRIAFRVASGTDSRIILDTMGANRLVGKGDLLFQSGGALTRIQCAFIDTPEVNALVDFISDQRGYTQAYALPEVIENSDASSASSSSASSSGMLDPNDRDELYAEVAEMLVLEQRASISFIQQKFAIGYNRAARLMLQLEAGGVVSSGEGGKSREVLPKSLAQLDSLINTES